MNTQHELKLYVERAVRPVVAVSQTKLKMRAELYAHVQDVYRQELGRQVDERDDTEAALEQTFHRTGDPTALTAEYQASVPQHEQIEARVSNFLDDRLRRREGDTRIRHAWRVASFFTVAVALFISLILLAFGHSEIFAWTFRGQIMVRFGIGVAFFFGVNLFLHTILSGIVRDRLALDVTWPRLAMYCLGYSAFAAPCLLASGWGLAIALGCSPETATETLSNWVPIAMAIPGLSGLAFYLDLWERRKSQEWTSLEIDS